MAMFSIRRIGGGLCAAVIPMILSVTWAEAACNIIGGNAYGDCAGVQVNNSPSPARTITGTEAISGVIAGASVQGGGQLTLSGISNGDITVSNGATLRVTGMVHGVVRNLGGEITIDGSVSSVWTNGGVVRVSGIVGDISGEGRLVLESGALVGGVPMTEKSDRQLGGPQKTK